MTEPDFWMQGDEVYDPPTADPQIQVDYEAALGRFLVAFNKVDNELEGLISTLLKVLSREDLIKVCTVEMDFSRKVLVLDLLSLSNDPGDLKSAPISEMRQLGKERNVVAHGHFEQNPFKSDYRLVGKGRYSDYSPTRLDGLTDRCNVVWNRLRHLRLYYLLDREEIEDLQLGAHPG